MSSKNDITETTRIIREMARIQMEYSKIKPSEFDLGIRYLYGYTRRFDDNIYVDIPVDYEEAFKRFKSDLATGRGFYGVGIMLINGLGVDKDFEKANQCFELAWSLLNENAGTNDGSFDRIIGDIYLCGKYGQPRDIQKAKARYISAAQKGDGAALYELAYQYLFGEKVTPGWKADKVKALHYAKRAVLHPHYDNKYAGYIAGSLLDEMGREDEALKYFEHAASLGQDDSQVVIGLYYEDMNVYELAVPMYRRAYEQGNVFAQFKLGYCYYYGLSIERDTQKGLRMIHNAALKGDEDAKIFLNNL